MADVDSAASKEKTRVEAIKKAYAVSDALYDIKNLELIGEGRTTILNLLTETRNLAIECGCEALVDAADALRMLVAQSTNMSAIRDEVVKLKLVAMQCV